MPQIMAGLYNSHYYVFDNDFLDTTIGLDITFQREER